MVSKSEQTLMAILMQDFNVHFNVTRHKMIILYLVIKDYIYSMYFQCITPITIWCRVQFILNIELIYVGKQPTLDQNDGTELIVPLPAP